MKSIQLKELRMNNFKGIIEMILTVGVATNIFGANESGKSTCYTAVNWLLTGKDEFDRKDYELKNTKRRDLNQQAHEVEGIFDVDGRELILKRAYYEKWTRPTGESTKVFDGHKTEFWINNVKKSATEYQAKVDEMIPAKIIKLITNPYYFNTLNWDIQRSGLLSIAGEITNDDVFDSISTPEKNYGSLINEFNKGETAEGLKKEYAAKKLALKKIAVEFAPRIDEATRALPVAENWTLIEKQIATKKADIAHIDNLLSDASTALSAKQSSILEKQKELFKKQTLLSTIRTKIKNDFEAKQTDGTGKIAQLDQQIKTAIQTIDQLKKTAQNNADNKNSYQVQIENKNAIVVACREAWSLINAEVFSFDDSKCECPTCKQKLPTENIATQKKELLKNFNTSVLQRKQSQVDVSNQAKKEIEQLTENIAAIDKLGDPIVAINHEQSVLATLRNEVATLKDVESKKVVVDVEAAVDALMLLNADALNLNDEMKFLNESIAAENKALNEEVNNDVEKENKTAIEAEIKLLENKLALKKTIADGNLRIATLKKEEEATAQAIADLELLEFDLQTYTRARMDILEERVNGMFKYVKFRMFNKLVNGTIEETCVCEYNGVPYPTLNTAAKLLSGLDILATLSNFYGIKAPVFCDNRESVTFIPPTDLQIISLFVSPEDKVLRVENTASIKQKRKTTELFEA